MTPFTKPALLRIAIVTVLAAIAWYLLQISSSVTAVPIARPLSEFPTAFADYRLSSTFQSSAGVLELLGVDDQIQYGYVSASGLPINFYVGFYHAVGVDGGYHSPKNCIPGGGWGINDVREVRLERGIEGSDAATVSEMIIQNGAQYQVVLYWFQNRGRIIASEYWEKIYLVLDALFKGRRDGTFIRIMAPAPQGDIAAAQAAVKAFAEAALPLLEQHLPGTVL
jgi:EpsI family protein